VTVSTVEEALRQFICGKRLQKNAALVEEIVIAYRADTLTRASDAKLLPYGVAVLLTRELGSDCAVRLQPADLTHNVLEDQMARFHSWFSKAMCDTPHRYRLHRLLG
jgi:hypothetical protein